MKCSQCGAQLPEGARFCDQCGQPCASVPPFVRPPVQPPPAPLPNRHAPQQPPPNRFAPPVPPTPAPSPVAAPKRSEESPPAWAPPGARPPAAPSSGRPAVPRPPQPPATPPSTAELASAAQPFSPPPLPTVPRPDMPANTAPQDPGQWFAPQRSFTAPAPEVDLPGEVTLVLVDSNTPFILSGREQYLIGREDPEEGIFPDLDLTLSGGEEAGVSRRHALLSYRNGAFWLEDLNSTNYTFINGVRIEPQRPQVLRDGDLISFAKLRIRFQQGRSTQGWR